MPSFKYTWDDFSGGYYVGQLDNRQPKNTFTGSNVAVANDDGAAVPAYPFYKKNFTASGSPSWIDANGNIILNSTGNLGYCSAPVAYSGRLFFAGMEPAATGWNCYVYATSVETIESTSLTVYRTSALNITTISNTFRSICTDPVCIQTSANTIDVYVAFFTNTVYRYTFTISTLTWSSPTTISTAAPTGPIPAGKRIMDLTIWNSRIVATVFESDYLYFSNALDYATWSTLNFLAPGANSDSILSIVPRQDDLFVLKPSGVYIVSGVLGASSYVRKYKNNVNPGYNWLHCVAEHDGQIYYVNRDLQNNWNLDFRQSYNISQLIGNNEIAAYYNFGYQIPGALENNGGSTQINTSGVQFPSVITTANNYLTCAFVPFPPSPDATDNLDVFCVLYKYRGIWQRRLFSVMPNTSTTTGLYRFAAAKNNSYVDDYNYTDSTAMTLTGIPIFQYSVRSSPNGLVKYGLQVSAGSFAPVQSAAGINRTSNTFSSGSLITSQVTSEKPSKITRVYVEAEYNKLQDNTLNTTAPNATPQMTVTVNNLAVDDVSFSDTLTYSSTSATYTAGPISSLGTYPSTRVIRFDANDTGYGYKHNIKIDYSGLRIKAIWAEGESR